MRNLCSEKVLRTLPTLSHFVLHPSSFLGALGLWRGAHTLCYLPGDWVHIEPFLDIISVFLPGTPYEHAFPFPMPHHRLLDTSSFIERSTWIRSEPVALPCSMNGATDTKELKAGNVCIHVCLIDVHWNIVQIDKRRKQPKYQLSNNWWMCVVISIRNVSPLWSQAFNAWFPVDAVIWGIWGGTTLLEEVGDWRWTLRVERQFSLPA